MEFLLFFLLIGIIALLVPLSKKKSPPPKAFKLRQTPNLWKKLLHKKVHFYRNLNENQKLQFESDVQRFLAEVKIHGVRTEVDLEDRLLVAASAVIPLFGFPAWNYKNLDEVLLYPGAFDRNFNLIARGQSGEEFITGMVGNGAMEGKMILSKPSLHLGFDNAHDKKNVGIHEFVHLFDKEGGAIDAIPPGFESKEATLPWMELIREKIKDIHLNQSDINPYAGTNPVEFFAVAAEYFFERPHLLQSKHPELYKRLTVIFNQDPSGVIQKDSFTKAKEPGRNDPCPCGSGRKYKKCCLN